MLWFVVTGWLLQRICASGKSFVKVFVLQRRSTMGDGDKTVQPTGRARGRARGRPRTAEELAAMRRPGETTNTPATSAQG